MTSSKVFSGPGDTIRIQAINFSQRGDVKENWVVFPDISHKFQRILMYYTLKCDPQNSPYRCGEWDYLTYTYASKKTNEYKKFPNFKVDGAEKDSFSYMKTPSWLYSSHFEYETINSDTLDFQQTMVGDTSNSIEKEFISKLDFQKTVFLWKADELAGAGLMKKNITGIALYVADAPVNLGRVMIRMALTKKDSVNQHGNDIFEVVFDGKVQLSANGVNYFPFFNSFQWDSFSNILVEMILFAPSEPVKMLAHPVNYLSSSQSASSDYTLFFENLDYIVLPQNLFSSITNEVTFAFWQYGNPKYQPQNNTVFEGVDSANRRIFNVHLPWGDGHVYWDAGNDGSGYDRIEKLADTSSFKGKWNFWAFTKNTSTGEMKIYLNGVLFQSGASKSKSIKNVKTFRIGSNAAGTGNFYDGMLDEFSVWNKALGQADIQKIMYNPPKPSDAIYNNLVAWFPFDEGQGKTVKDISPNKWQGKMNTGPGWKPHSPVSLFKNMRNGNFLPEIIFDQSNYQQKVTRNILTDSIENQSNMLILFSNFSKPDIPTDTLYVYPPYQCVLFDSNGKPVQFIKIKPDSVIYKIMTEAKYDEKYRILDRYEIGRFITPYGINLDLGDGFTWIYDVSDYAPLLHDSVKISSGNWQELHQLDFVMIEGTPPRDVLSVQTLYSGSFGLPNFASLVQPKWLTLNKKAEYFRVKTRTTGHGMAAPNNCAEFCPKYHELWLNDTMRYRWLLWTECASNPLYPQGGTWIYDRAGWCPGAPVYTYDWEVSSFIDKQKDSVKIDYNAESDAGGNFVLESQLISYSDFHFSLDAAVVDIIVPNKHQEYLRENPHCANPRVLVQNTGKQKITSIEFNYGKTDGTYSSNFRWSGQLEPLDKTEIELPFYWGGWTGDNRFRVSVSKVNNATDDYSFNNTVIKEFEIPPVYPNRFVVYLRTNSFPQESRCQISDAAGNIVYKRENLQANKLYMDTLTLPNTYGCYTLKMLDTDGDGLSFWNNNDGNGYLRLRSLDGPYLKMFNPDFGNEIIHNFTTGWALDIRGEKLITENSLKINPNPSSGKVFIEFDLKERQDVSLQLSDMNGQVIWSRSIKATTGEIIELNLENQPDGLYFFSLFTKENILTQKFIIGK